VNIGVNKACIRRSGAPNRGAIAAQPEGSTVLLVMGYLRVRGADIARLRGPVDRLSASVREFHGCEHYSFGIDILEPELLRVAERWRTRAAQSAHLVGDHMVDFNIGMRAAQVVEASVSSYENGVVRRLMEIPASSFRGERTDKAMVVVTGSVRTAPGEIERLLPDLATLTQSTRAEEGCELYAFARDLLDPQLLHLSEQWRDRKALGVHFATPHVAAFNNVLAGAKIEAMSVKAYEGDGERVLVER
jgi:quinol monooxygenase YgiN